MIVRGRNDGKVISVIPGVKFTLLQSGERVMLVLVEVSEGSMVPEHNHPHEQLGLCLKGSAQFESDSGVTTVRKAIPTS